MEHMCCTQKRLFKQEEWLYVCSSCGFIYQKEKDENLDFIRYMEIHNISVVEYKRDFTKYLKTLKLE